MDASRAVVRFGPFSLDRTRGWLLRDGQREPLSKRHTLVLLTLTRQPGVLVTRDTLLTAGWPASQVGDDSLRKVISDLRALCGTRPDGESCIGTVSGRGYVWQLPFTPERVDITAPALPAEWEMTTGPDPLLVPDAGSHSDVINGRAALETLGHDGIQQAARTFMAILGSDTPLPSAHAGLAAVLFLMMESMRADGPPDPDLLARARQHALAAWQQAPDSAFAWISMALVRHWTGFTADAIAAARLAVARDEREWRYHLVHAYVSHGSERLRAASRVLELSPQNALGHWLAATVFVARRAFTPLLEHLRAGCAMQTQADLLQDAAGVLPPAGLHLLHGQVLAAMGDPTAAAEALARELATAGQAQVDKREGHVYKREACANACYTLAVLAWRDGDADAAGNWVRDALAHVPQHPFARLFARHLRSGGWGRSGGAGRAGGAGESGGAGRDQERDLLNLALVQAAELALDDRHEEAARVMRDRLQASTVPLPGSAWQIPVEPLLDVSCHPDAWASVLALLHARAL